MQSTIKKHDDMRKSMSAYKNDDDFARQPTSSINNLTFNEMELLEILSKVALFGDLARLRNYLSTVSIENGEFYTSQGMINGL